MDLRCFLFGSFAFMPQRQILLRGGRPVRIGARALELLAQFVQRPGEVIEKRELVKLVWAGTFVDESNLKVNIAALRKAIDCDNSLGSCIATTIGRGYRFVAPVKEVTLDGPSLQFDQPGQNAGQTSWPVRGKPKPPPTLRRLVTVVHAPDISYAPLTSIVSGSLRARSRQALRPGYRVEINEHDWEGRMPKQYSTLTLGEAKAILAAAESKAESIGIAYNIAVVDAGGHLLAFSRQDGALIGSIDLAIDKASTARIFDKETSFLGSLAQSGKPLFGIQESNAGKVVIFGGGIPILFEGQIIGAVGASAGTVEQDIAVAEAGIAAFSHGRI